MSRAVPAAVVATLASLLAAGLAACGSGSKPAPIAPPGPGDTKLSAAVLTAVCHAEHVDSSSTIFVAATPDGHAHRLVVTPSRRIADMGNLIFAIDGTFLGHDTGGEVPWDDQAFMTEERARVAALMDGATVPGDQTPQPCP